MKYEDGRVGQKVLISENLRATSENFGLTREMKDLKGKILTITKCYYDDRKPVVKLDDTFRYSWHPNDLTIVEEYIEKEKPEQLFHYNIEELVL